MLRGFRSFSRAAVVLTLGATGCVETLQQSGKHATTGAIEASVQAAEDPDTRHALSIVAADPEVRAAVGSLSRQVSASVVDGLTEEARIARLEELAGRLTSAVASSMAVSLDREIGPAVERLVARSVARALSDGFGPEAETRIEALSAAAARGAFRGMSEAMGDVNLEGAVTPAGAIARQVSKQAALGFQDAVRLESKKQDPDSEGGDGDVLAALGETADATLQVTPWLLWTLVAVVVGALGLSGYLLIQRRRDRRGPPGEQQPRQELPSKQKTRSQAGLHWWSRGGSNP